MEQAEAAGPVVVRGGAHRFWCLVAANYIAWLGSVTTLIAVPFYVLESTGRAFDAGLAGAANTLPMALGGVAGGAIVDRFGPRIAGVAAGLAGASCMVALPLLGATTGLAFAALLVLLFLRSLFDTPTAAARLSLLSERADEAGYTRETANAIFQAGQRVALVIGPPIAALLIARFGALATLYIDAVAFAAAAVLLLAAAPAAAKAGGTDRSEPVDESIGAHFIGGIRLIRDDPRLFAMVRVFVLTNLIEDAFAPVILPIYARDILGDPLAVSLPVIAFGIGSLAGTVAYIPVAKRVPSRFSLFIGSLAVIAFARAALVMEPGLVALGLLSFVVGFASGPLNPIVTILVQDAVPKQALGRAFGALIGIAFAAIPIGIFVAGLLVETVGLRATLAAYAALYLAVLVQAARSRALRTI